MLRVFGFAAGLALAVVVVFGVAVVVVFGAIVAAVGAVVVVLFVAGGMTDPGATVVPVVLGLLDPGMADVVGVVAGSSVMGVGTGGNGLDITVAIISFKPASDLSCRNL